MNSITEEKITGHTIVIVSKDQIYCDLNGESVILNFKDGVYYGLDSLGTIVWNNIQEPKTINEIEKLITEQYDVPPERCKDDLLKLIKELETNKLIELRNDATE